ncbi:transglycosylase domain-containing protein [Phototrophicus methaneseepsis]|uniref:Transglycosylase domain-containing protein n=1 Tax=Phototrophicus methaneseepsis TaxID=2710758 RepID=A0A7S8E8P4_9CHLR|nr:transglycosylase domain-containing protein [Phototrophicus methaneseepsis]QPC82443.1 transglycosylase domain-containing protein [Phototrophicus methaneseepsis]
MSSITQIIRRRRTRKSRLRESHTRSQVWGVSIMAVIAAVVIVPLVSIFGLAGYLYLRAAPYLPTQAQSIQLEPILGSTEIYDRNGSTLIFSVTDPLGNERRWLPLSDLPEYVVQATLEMEDADFLETGQFKLDETLGRLWRYLLGLQLTPDNSITARFVRNGIVPLAAESDLDDLLLEIVLTAEVQQRYDPLEIVEWHLNTNYYGNDAYGIDAAAQIYLGKSAVDLTLDEAAMLAAIPLQPKLNPFDDLVAARGRQADLLQRMVVSGRILEGAYETAAATTTPINASMRQLPELAPDFALYARTQAEDILSSMGLDGERLVARGALTITTTLDVDLYDQSECVLRAHLAQLQGGTIPSLTTRTGQPCQASNYLYRINNGFTTTSANPPDDGQIMLMDLATGEILSMVGIATEADYAPGPTLYPFVYLEGLRRKLYTPASMLLDIPRHFPGPAEGLLYLPNNPDGQFRGPRNLRDVMASGLRVPAVSVAEVTGISQMLSTAQRLGLPQPVDNAFDADLELLERGGQVSLLDMAYAYSVFGSQGYMVGVEPLDRSVRPRNPVAVLKIEDSDGQVLWEYTPEEIAISRTNMLESDLAYLVTDILADINIRRDMLNTPLDMIDLGRPGAIVTGSTGGDDDNWAVGYTPQRLAGVHLMRSDGEAMALDDNGLNGAAPVWRALMQYMHARDHLDAASWPKPDGIAEYVVCERSGLTPGPDSECPRRTEIFLRDVAPTQEDSHWQMIVVNNDTGQLATNETPPQQRLSRLYFIPPDAAREWWEETGQVLPPTEYDRTTTANTADLAITEPQRFSYVGGQVEVWGSINVLAWDTYQLAYGEGFMPTEWFNIGEPGTTYDPTQPLAVWDTTGLEGGYTLQLSVRNGNTALTPVSIYVTIDNEPPELTLMTSEPGKVYRFPTDSVITLVTTGDDDYDRMEFYRDGALIGEGEDWPFYLEVPIREPGNVTFSATAYDQAGNSTTAELLVEIIRGG